MKVLIAGDFCPQNRVAELFENKQFVEVLEQVRPIIEEADFSIVNVECPVTRKESKPIEKYGPNIYCTETGIEAVKWAGFDCVTLANNHFLDYGKEGVNTTLEICRKYNIEVVGGGQNIQEASKILYKEIEGKSLAVINCCEHEFSIATNNSSGSNPLNPIHQYYAIQEAKSKANYVLIIVHGGHENYQLPSPRMQEIYRFFIDAGADAVVNHHQHCYSGYEVYKEKPIFYGLGNFCFDKNRKMVDTWYEGYMLLLFFEASHIDYIIYPYKQCFEKPKIVLQERSITFDMKLSKLNDIISSADKLRFCVDNYYDDSQNDIYKFFGPFGIKSIKGVLKGYCLPLFLSKRKRLKLQNLILCESHRDRVRHFFETIFNEDDK